MKTISQHYFITGASSGIGYALSEKLAADGHKLSVLARRTDRLEALAAAHPNLLALSCDVTDEAAIHASVKTAMAHHGPVDVAVLNAGIYQPQDSREMEPDIYARHMDVNYMGVVRSIAALLPDMLARKHGHLALMASVAGYRGLPLAAAYSPTKAAVIALAESMMFDLRDSGVKLQIINPGFVETEATDVNQFEMPDIISAETAADEIIAGLQADQFEIAFPRSFVRKMRILRLLPNRWYFRLMQKVISK